MGFTRKKKKKERKFKVYYYTRLSTNIFFERKNRMDKFFRTEIRGEEEGFSSKAEFYRADDQSFERKWGRKKSFLDRGDYCIDAADIDIKSHYSYSISGDVTQYALEQQI